MTDDPNVRVLSRGNRTEVSCAPHVKSRRLVVTKCLRSFADVSSERTALYHEALVQRGARGSGVVPILDPPLSHVLLLHEVGEVSQETPVLRRPYVDGFTIRELLAEEQPRFGATECFHWIGELCTTLDRVHHLEGVDGGPLLLVHRDVTPGNILIESDTVQKKKRKGVWLNDFGLAHVGAWGPLRPEETLQGTRRFIAPELAAGEQPTSATDVYQVGLLLSLMLGKVRGVSPPPANSGPKFQWWARDILREIRAHDVCSDLPHQRPSAGDFARFLGAL
jgi:serine/threonine protein kinase